MTSPLITVAIPAYNHAPFIAEAIKSALTQEGVELEVVVVDDASTDETAAIAESFAARDSRVRVFQNPYNLGPSLTSQAFLKHARGQYICTLPSDDMFAPGKLVKQLAMIESNSNLALVASGVAFMDEASQLITHQRHFASGLFDCRERSRAEWMRYFFNVGNCICASGPLVRTDLFRRFSPDPRLIQLQDYDCWVRMVLAGYDIGVVNEPLTFYRILPHHKNLSAPSRKVLNRILFEHIKVLDRFTSLNSFEDLMAITMQQLNDIPEDVNEEICVQHQLSMHAWMLGRSQHRSFALENWYRMFGQEECRGDLYKLGVNSRFLAEKTAANPLAAAQNASLRAVLLECAEYFLPRSVRNFLACRIKIKMENKKWLK